MARYVPAAEAELPSHFTRSHPWRFGSPYVFPHSQFYDKELASNFYKSRKYVENKPITGWFCCYTDKIHKKDFG